MATVETVKNVAEECLDKAKQFMKDSIVLECHEDGSFDFNMVIKKVEVAIAVAENSDAKMKD